MPNVFIQYWSMRVMAYLGSLRGTPRRCGACWLLWRRRLDTSRVFLWLRDLGGADSRSSMNTAGWLLTENGRQPWIVQGLMLT